MMVEAPEVSTWSFGVGHHREGPAMATATDWTQRPESHSLLKPVPSLPLHLTNQARPQARGVAVCQAVTCSYPRPTEDGSPEPIFSPDEGILVSLPTYTSSRPSLPGHWHVTSAGLQTPFLGV